MTFMYYVAFFCCVLSPPFPRCEISSATPSPSSGCIDTVTMRCVVALMTEPAPVPSPWCPVPPSASLPIVCPCPGARGDLLLPD